MIAGMLMSLLMSGCAAGLPMAAHMRTRAHTAHAATHKIALWTKPREQEPSFAVAVVCCCCWCCLLSEILYGCWHVDVIVDVISNSPALGPGRVRPGLAMGRKER